MTDITRIPVGFCLVNSGIGQSRGVPIPYNIDGPRFLGACLGIRWSGEFSFEMFAERLGSQLGFLPEETSAFLSSFAERAVAAVKPLTTREGMLKLGAHLKTLLDELRTTMETHLKDPAARARVEEFVTSRKATIEAMDGKLAAFVLTFWMVRLLEPSAIRVVREAQAVATLISLRHSDQYKRALECWNVYSHASDEKGMMRFGQDVGHVGYRMMPATVEAESGTVDLHARLLDAIPAWCDTYEGLISHICNFLWLAKRKMNEPADLAAAPRGRDGRIQKGAVYNEVRDWCERQNFAFPFYPYGVLLRNHYDHKNYFMDDARQQFDLLDEEGKPVTTEPKSLAYQDIYNHILHDINFANFFYIGLLLERLFRANLAGEIDDAWRSFKRRTSDLSWVFDWSIDFTSPYGEPGLTRNEVEEYLSGLSPTEMSILIDELRHELEGD